MCQKDKEDKERLQVNQGTLKEGRVHQMTSDEEVPPKIERTPSREW